MIWAFTGSNKHKGGLGNMKNRKTLVAIVAIVAILALMLMALTGCGDDTQTKIDAAVKEAQEAFDKTKTDLEGQVTDLTTKLADAEAAAKKAAEDAEADVKTKVEEAVAAAQAEADKVKADLEAQVTDLQTKLDEATKASDDAATDAQTQINDAVTAAGAAAQKEAEDTAAKVKAEADKAKILNKVYICGMGSMIVSAALLIIYSFGFMFGDLGDFIHYLLIIAAGILSINTILAGLQLKGKLTREKNRKRTRIIIAVWVSVAFIILVFATFFLPQILMNILKPLG